MTSDDDKLSRLVADLRKAVIRAELHRGYEVRPKPSRSVPVGRPRAA